MQNLNKKKQNYTSQKGITLIALIITIIVMLILVGVTINIALNGGLFKNAETAAKQMQIKADEEVLYAEVLAVYDAKTGTIDTEKLKTNLQAMGWTVNSNGNPFICTSPKGNTFEITIENGNIKIEYKGNGNNEGNGPTGGGGNQTANDFEITVEQTPNGSPVTSATLTIRVSNIENIIPDFTEAEAAAYVGEKWLYEDDITSLEVLIIRGANAEYKTAYTDDQYTTMIQDMRALTGEELATPQDAFIYMMTVKGYTYETVQEFAKYLYMPTTKTLKIRKGQGEWTDITKVASWGRYEYASYQVTSNGTYEIKIEIDGKTSTKTIEVNKIEQETYTNEEVLKALGITNYTGTYNGTWTKIETENGKTKLVSTSDVTSCTLGENDNLEKSISDYKNAVSILNTSAQQATGIASARSINIEDIYGIIGEENVNKGTRYGIQYNYYYNTEGLGVYCKYETGTDENGEIIWSTGSSTGDSSQTFVDDNGNTVVVDSAGDEVTLTDTYYYKDLTEDQKAEIGTLATGHYWLASPCVNCFSDNANFCVRSMDGRYISNSYLFSSGGSANGDSYGVRAVVSVSGL